jgi:hypothetical protein
MKKSLLFIITSMSLVGCGKNAFINSNDLSLINNAESEALKIDSYIGSNAMALSGNIDTGFDNQIRVSTGTKSVENFSSQTNGATLSISNSIDGIGYTMEHVDDDMQLGSTRRNLYVENPVSQDSAVGQGSGIDFNYGSFQTRNSMLVSFDTPISHFGIDLLDFESDSNFTIGKLRAYDCSATPKKVYDLDIDFGAENGNAQTHFLGIISNKKEICKIILTVGDDSTGNGFNERFAIDNLRFGSATN